MGSVVVADCVFDVAMLPQTPQPTAYLLGIAGAGMRSLTVVLEQLGWQIFGSDAGDTSTLPTEWQAKLTDELPPLRGDDVLIHSPAIDARHPLLQAARQLDYRVCSYPEMLGRLMQSRQGIAIAGTHGKSTTTAMTAAIFRQAALDPTVIVGAEPIVPGTASGAGQGGHLIVEACEYRDSFLQLRPTIAAILNIEWDHCDWFATLAEVEAAFARFGGQVANGGTLVVPYGRLSCHLLAQLKHGGQSILSFGLHPAADVCAQSLECQRGRYQFNLILRGHDAGSVQLPTLGQHNVQNALAAAAVAHAAGVASSAICAGLSAFGGLKRRLEYLGNAAGIHFIDDFAHHPTEIAAALAAVRQGYPGSRIWCVFEPHRASRTNSLLYDLALSLQNTDTLAIGEIYRVREHSEWGATVTSADLAKACGNLGICVRDVHDWATLEQALVAARHTGELASGDVLVTLGAGKIGTLAHGVFQRFRENFTHERAVGSAHLV